MERVLAIGCHIDDIELGCGGTLLKHRDAGDEICLAVLKSDDDLAGDPGARIFEQIKSADILNAKAITFSFKTEVQKIVGTIEAVVKPTIIYFPYEKDHHQDHVKAFLVGQAIGRNPEINLFGYLVTTSYGYVPNYFSVIDIKAKKELINVFETQIMRKNRYIQIMENQNGFFGTLIHEEGVFAEGFVQYRNVWR